MDRKGVLFEGLVRFTLGGMAVVGCYLVSFLVPVKLVAGMFAAFPAIMVSSVALTGYRDGNELAGEVAKGAVAGMIGCTLCVVAAIFFIKLTASWLTGLLLGIPVWLAGAMLTRGIADRAKKVKGEQL